MALSQAGKVSHSERVSILGQYPVTVWLTGLSGAGKTTLATGLEKALIEGQRACFVLDGDIVRAGLSRDLGFGADDRHENIRRVAEVARLMNEAGLIVICALISPYRADRDRAREIVGADRFVEIYLDAPLDICERRDPKGLYRKARRGEIADFTGVSAPYEPPVAPAAVVHTAQLGVEQCIQQLVGVLGPRINPRS
jgi:adenylyl-sulfate kinase